MEIPDSEIVAKINSMTYTEMAYAYRFYPSGHGFFDRKLPYRDIFMKRFVELGGMTPKISKLIGWNEMERKWIE